MDTPSDKYIRRNSVIVALLLVIAIIGGLALIPSSALPAMSASVTFTAAIVLPIRQKRFSMYSVFLAIVGILFLLSGVIGNAADKFLNSLSVSDQIEFSRIVRPNQVSRGLWNVGIGICNALLAWSWWTKFRNRVQQSKTMNGLFLILGVVGILFIISGISTIIDGLSRL